MKVEHILNEGGVKFFPDKVAQFAKHHKLAIVKNPDTWELYNAEKKLVGTFNVKTHMFDTEMDTQGFIKF